MGWLAQRQDEEIREEAAEMVGALEEVAYNNTITELGESTMVDIVELCTMLSEGPAVAKVEEEGEDNSHHHQEIPLKEEGVPGDKAVVTACSNGMPGSKSQASPGGTCPRTTLVNISSNFYTIEEESGSSQQEDDQGAQEVPDQGQHKEEEGQG